MQVFTKYIIMVILYKPTQFDTLHYSSCMNYIRYENENPVEIIPTKQDVQLE